MKRRSRNMGPQIIRAAAQRRSSSATSAEVARIIRIAVCADHPHCRNKGPGALKAVCAIISEENPNLEGASGGEGKYKGTIDRFFEDKGFGFVKSDDGGDDVFVHVNDNPELAGGDFLDWYFGALNPRSTRSGTTWRTTWPVSFDKEWDDRNCKYKGTNVQRREAADDRPTSTSLGARPKRQLRPSRSRSDAARR
jgi:hypothetical protein